MIEISTQLEIAAPLERVWHVLTDFAAYSQWNPFIRQLSGELKVGAVLWMQTLFFGSKIMKFRARVTRLEPGRELRWLGHFFVPRLFDGEHAFRLEPQTAESTRLVHFEIFSGLLVPFFAGKLGEKTRHGFEQMN